MFFLSISLSSFPSPPVLFVTSCKETERKKEKREREAVVFSGVLLLQALPAFALPSSSFFFFLLPHRQEGEDQAEGKEQDFIKKTGRLIYLQLKKQKKKEGISIHLAGKYVCVGCLSAVRTPEKKEEEEQGRMIDPAKRKERRKQTCETRRRRQRA